MVTVLSVESYIALLKTHIDIRYASRRREIAKHSFDNARASQRPFFSILDSLASICVPGRGIHVAVALAVDGAVASLYVASGGGGTSGELMIEDPLKALIVPLLKDLWEKLRQLRDLDSDSTVATEKRKALHAMLCESYFCKLKHGVGKKLRVCFQEIIQILEGQLHDSSGSTIVSEDDYAEIQSLAERLDDLFAPMKSHAQDIAAYFMDLETRWIPRLRGDDNILDRLDMISKSHSLLLRRYLEKLSTFRYHCHTIIGLAYSPRFKVLLDCDLDVIPIPASRMNQEPITIDLDKEVWRSAVQSTELGYLSEADFDTIHEGWVQALFNDIQAKSHSPPPSWANEHDQKLVFSDSASKASSAGYHPECAVLCYLRQHGIHTYPYIGASRDLCYGCDVFFSAYNSVSQWSQMNPTFYHRGSDGKVKLPWVMPPNEDMYDAQGNLKAGEVSEEMVDILVKDLEGFAYETRWGRKEVPVWQDDTDEVRKSCSSGRSRKLSKRWDFDDYPVTRLNWGV